MSISTPNRPPNGARSPEAFAGLPQSSAQPVQDFLREPGRLLIGGEWVEAASGEIFDALNSATE